MAVWEKVVYPTDIFNLLMFHDKHYIISTGGDFNLTTNVSYPGFAIYHEGMDVTAVMVTRFDVYNLKVRGQLLNNTWTNYAFRFINYVNNSFIPYESRGGLELYINGLKVGHAIVPLDRPAGGWKASTVLQGKPTDPTWKGVDIGAPLMMIGCQRNSDDKKFRNFCMANATYDELAIWTRKLKTNASVDETQFFTGGYVAQFDGISPSQWKEMLSKVQLSDPSQMEMAGVITTMMAGEQESTVLRNMSTVDFNRTDDEFGNYSRQMLKFDTAWKLLDLTGLKTLDRAKYLVKRYSVIGTAAGSLEDTPENIDGWNSVYMDPNEAGASQLVKRIEDYILLYTASANIKHDESYPNTYSANRSEFVVHSQSPGMTMSVTKVFPSRFSSYPSRVDIASFYNSHSVSPNPQWFSFLETIEIPTDFVFTNNSLCQQQPFSLLTALYPGYGKMAPNRRAPQFIPSGAFKIDSKIISVKMMLSPTPGGDMTKNFSSCQLDQVQTKYSPIRIRFYHIDNQTSLRKLLWHENELQSNIALRRCVVYDESIGMFGAWNTQPCKTVLTEQEATVCECSIFGTFAVEAEYVDPAEYDSVFTWVGVIKYMGYFFSLVTMVIFFFLISFSSELWDQFHILRCHTAVACFIALLSMMITEVEFVRTDRHSNIAISLMQQYWFQTVAYLLFAESFATFRAITGGIIGGKTWAYLTISYGMPFINTGVALYLYGSDYGTDPRAFIGWENATKLAFFYGQIPATAISMLICFIIIFNISLPQTRKDSIIDQLSSQGTGLSVMVFIFFMTWWFAYPAFLRFPGNELPDFYPIFIVLNSWTGVFFFVLMGVMSSPFRTALMGGGSLRANPLFMYMQTGQKLQEEEFHELSRTPSSTSLNSVADSLDEDIEKGLPINEEKKEEDLIQIDEEVPPIPEPEPESIPEPDPVQEMLDESAA